MEIYHASRCIVFFPVRPGFARKHQIPTSILSLKHFSFCIIRFNGHPVLFIDIGDDKLIWRTEKPATQKKIKSNQSWGLWRTFIPTTRFLHAVIFHAVSAASKKSITTINKANERTIQMGNWPPHKVRKKDWIDFGADHWTVENIPFDLSVMNCNCIAFAKCDMHLCNHFRHEG